MDIDSAFPLDGLKVLDFSMGVAGPTCACLLAQHGADVIKVEPPIGDWGRPMGLSRGSLSVSFAAYNRGKRGIVLDVGKPEGRDIAHRLAADADIVVESYRPGIVSRLGLDYGTLLGLNPNLTYVSVTGYGQDGPYRDMPATDAIVQSLTGLVNLNRPDDGSPHKIQIILIDLVAGLYAFHNILMTLLKRARGATGGHRIEAPLLHIATWLQATRLGEYVLAEGNPPMENVSPVGTFEATDGLITIVALRDDQWRRLCKVVGREDLPEDPRYLTIPLRLEHDAALKAELRPIFKTRSVAEWSALLTEADILHHKVLDYGEFLAHPQLAHMKLLIDNDHPGLGRFPLVGPPGAAPLTPDDPRRTAPRLGQHTREVLAEMGMQKAEIEALIAAGIAAADDAEAAAIG